MKPCPEYKDILLLDLYGELEQHERSAWQEHLKNCKACQEERKRLQNLLNKVKSNMPSPLLSPEKAEALTSSVMQALKGKQEDTRWKKRFFTMPNRLIPALATASLLIAVFGWFGLKEFIHHPAFQRFSNISSEKQLTSEDLEVVKNMEFLENMEELENLIKFLENPEYGKIPQRQKNKIQYG